jgi:type II secretion system protein J
MKRTAAFTLLEMTLALAASAVILTAIFGVFSKAVHLRDNATARTHAARLRVHALNVLRNDLRNARVTGGADRTFANSLEGSQETHGSSYPGYLKFTTTTQADDLDDPSPDVQEVEYYIVNNPDVIDRKSGLLVRSANRDLLNTTRSQLAESPLLPDAVSMEVSFLDGTDWKSSWTVSDDDQTLPLAVRVRIEIANSSPIELLVPWNTQTLTDTSSSQ